MGYLSLVDIGLNVDDSTLRAELDERPTSDQVKDLVETQVNEVLGASNLTERVEALENLNTCGKDINSLVDESDVQSMLDNQDFVSEDRVSNMIDDAISSADFASSDDILSDQDVRNIVDEAISEADNALVNELEVRVDRYNQRVDALISGTQGVGTDTAVLEAQVLALSEDVGRKAEQVRLLQSRVDAMQHVDDTETAERIAALESRAQDGLTLLDLLRRAYSIIVGGRA